MEKMRIWEFCVQCYLYGKNNMNMNEFKKNWDKDYPKFSKRIVKRNKVKKK